MTGNDVQKQKANSGSKRKKMTPAMQKLRDALEKSVSSPQKGNSETPKKDAPHFMKETTGSEKREVFTPIPKDRKSSHGQYQV